MSKKYIEKLKDPRWQKKRLEVLNRDEWCCQHCYDNESTLCVHHKKYLPGKEPWDYPLEYFITLCESCHEEETETRQSIEKNLIDELKLKFPSSCDVLDLVSGFYELKLVHSAEVVASMIKWFLSNENLQRELIDRYFESLAQKNESK